MNLSHRKVLESISPYIPGKPIDEVKQELHLTNVLKLASNENPFGCSPLAKQAVVESLNEINIYPDGNCTALKKKLSEKLKVAPSQILFGAGSDEIITLIAEAFINPGEESIIGNPSFSRYESATKLMDGIITEVPLEDYRFDLKSMASKVAGKSKVIWICNPNNPTGTISTAAEIEDLLNAVPQDVVVVLDEAYHEYVTNRDYPNSIGLLDKFKNIIILRTFSKIYGLASLRIGYAITSEHITSLLNRIRGPFNVTTAAQKAAINSLDDDSFREMSVKYTVEGRNYLYGKFSEMGLKYIPSEANFIMVETGISSKDVFKEMLLQGIIIRSADIFGMDTWIRVTVGSPDENKAFIDALEIVLSKLRRNQK